MYTKEQFGKMIDNTLLRPDGTRQDVERLIDESASRHLAAVCVFPCWVGSASRLLQGTDVKVCTVVSFPFGSDTRVAKNFMVRNAILNGAQEIDVVLNIGKLKQGDLDGVKRDLNEVIDGIRSTGGALHSDDSRRVLCKVIIETCYLTDDEKEIASRLVRDSGADFVKTSTGTGPSGATVEDIRLIRRALGPGTIGIKASGGIRTVEQAIAMLDAGANRIGTSAGATLYDAYDPAGVSK